MSVFARHTTRRTGQIGFTLIELSIVMVVAGLLLVPLLRMAGSAVISTRLKQTQSVLETASEALIAFAAAHGGCLPFAADEEGGQPDTDSSGMAGATPDTGFRNGNRNAGDLPWAELGLTNDFLEGEGLRIQYYVASPYTDDTGSYPNDCDAGFRGFQWKLDGDYEAPSSAQMWIYDFNPEGSSVRTLFEIKPGDEVDGEHPSDGIPDQVIAHSDPLPDPLLQVRLGPDVTAASPQNDVISSQNVFILIAPGKNRNTGIDRLFVRDTVPSLPHAAFPATARGPRSSKRTCTSIHGRGPEKAELPEPPWSPANPKKASSSGLSATRMKNSGCPPTPNSRRSRSLRLKSGSKQGRPTRERTAPPQSGPMQGATGPSGRPNGRPCRASPMPTGHKIQSTPSSPSSTPGTSSLRVPRRRGTLSCAASIST